jgi:multidrug efflux pump subunit AcrA (membrane-fusion protein)
VPAWRNLRLGDVGEDVHQLNEGLHALGDDAGRPIDPASDRFGAATEIALKALQSGRGLPVSGILELGSAAFLPGPVRIARVVGQLGASAQPDGHVLEVTSDRLVATVDLDPSEQGLVAIGDRAQVRLPGGRVLAGTVDRLGSVVRTSTGSGADSPAAILPVSIRLDDPAAARGFEAAPVRVDIATTGVQDALSVPVIALVGRTGGGFAVDVVRPDGRRELVAVTPGLFDTTAGRVEVEGGLQAGDRVVVPAS